MAAHAFATEAAVNDELPSFVTVAELYERTSRKGTKYWAGKWGHIRVYVFANTDNRKPKDAQPEYHLCVRMAEYDPGKVPG